MRSSLIMRRLAQTFCLAFLFAPLAACAGDEGVAAYGGAGQVWQLVSLDRAEFGARATLTFPEPGRIAGEAPCNRYNARQTAPYPWFKAEMIVATRRACPDMAGESAYLAALNAVSLAEVAGDTLILSDPSGRELVFRAVAPDHP